MTARAAAIAIPRRKPRPPWLRRIIRLLAFDAACLAFTALVLFGHGYLPLALTVTSNGIALAEDWRRLQIGLGDHPPLAMPEMRQSRMIPCCALYLGGIALAIAWKIV